MLRKGGSRPKDEVSQYKQFERLRMASTQSPNREQEAALKLRGLTVGSNILLKKLSGRRGKNPTILTNPIFQEELDYVQAKFQQWGQEMELFRKRKEARERAIETKSTMECTCWFGDVAIDKMILCRDLSLIHI